MYFLNGDFTVHSLRNFFRKRPYSSRAMVKSAYEKKESLLELLRYLEPTAILQSQKTLASVAIFFGDEEASFDCQVADSYVLFLQCGLLGLEKGSKILIIGRDKIAEKLKQLLEDAGHTAVESCYWTAASKVGFDTHDQGSVDLYDAVFCTQPNLSIWELEKIISQSCGLLGFRGKLVIRGFYWPVEINQSLSQISCELSVSSVSKLLAASKAAGFELIGEFDPIVDHPMIQSESARIFGTTIRLSFEKL